MNPTPPSVPDVSIVVPIYNEVENLPDLVARIRALAPEVLVGVGLGISNGDQAAAVADSYREYRRLQHDLRLNGISGGRQPREPHAARIAAVRALWAHVFPLSPTP